MTTRRKFLKIACLSGACLCGFGNVMESKALNAISSIDDKPSEENKAEKMAKRWIIEVLENINNNMQEEQVRSLVKSASIADYDGLAMDKVLAPYIGDIDRFNKFLENEWGWLIHYENGNHNVIIADENKPHCVCSLLKYANGKRYPALCYCSEGFAERMYTAVSGKQAKARIISAIQRGDKTCIYRIELI